MTSENNKKWTIKKKFMFAGAVLLALTLIASKGFVLATTVADTTILLASYATASGGILALIFAADVTDKKLNNGPYQK